MANKVILIGNVGKAPEVKTVGETKVANFTLATTERGYTKQDGTQVPDKTTWHNIVAWKALAEIVEKYVIKGTNLYIEGKIDNRSYDDANGVKKYISEIIVTSLEFVGKKDGGTAPTPSSIPVQPADDGGDLPF